MALASIKNSLFVTLGLAITVLVYGLLEFKDQWQYSEEGHETLLGIYVILSLLLFFLLRIGKIGISVLIMIILAATLFYSNQKFEWRKDYIMQAQFKKPFPLEPYIDSYPTFEEHTFSWFFGTPKWVDFNKECYFPLTKGAGSGRNCKSNKAIQENYNIDVTTLIQKYYKRMQNTAKLIENGRMKSKRQFEKCIHDKRCAMIPLLPKGIEIDRQSEEHMDVRMQFWSLINDKKMSQKNCDFFELCRVATQNGWVKRL